MQRREVLKGLTLMLGGGLSSACQKAVEVPVAERTVDRPSYPQKQQEIAHRVADLIIPATDTPGALDAGVAEFIDYVVTVWFNDQEKARFLEGLGDLEFQAGERFGSSFIGLKEEQQVQLLLQAEAAQSAGSPFAAFGSGQFFAQIKELTVVGYYTSEVGATVARKWVPMPGRYDGYYKFSDVGRQWSS